MALATPIRRRRALQATRPVPDGPDAAADAVIPDAETVDLLDQLGDACADSAHGFASCADCTAISQHRALFRKRASACEAARQQLQALALRRGAAPAGPGAARSDLRRGWVSAPGTLCGLRDSSIVAECERGEALTLERYRQVLRHALPADVRAVLEQQLQAIETSLQQIRGLREAMSATQQGAA